jgi:alginate O-acetyltransferase complex protein AlgI
MMFHTSAFIFGFLPVCLAGFFALGRLFGVSCALGWLVTCSLFFYGWWNPEHLALLIGSVVANYAIAWKLRHTDRPHAWLAAGIALNLAILGWFKYANFLLHIVTPNAPELSITLPLAISFFTFQQIMLLVDTGRCVTQTPVNRETRSVIHGPDTVQEHRDKRGGVTGSEDRAGRSWPGERDERNMRLPPFLTYAAFVTFFAHLIAGPIVRPSDIIPQLVSPDLVRPRIENISDGLLIFLLGLGKKLVLADMFGGFADTGFDAAAHGATLTFFEAWYATLSYALQIYFDFSGYSDMAIGLARMLNIRFPLNFDSPYQAVNIADFWRRWHITLGGFLRDYLYIPLGGNRTGRLRQTGTLMATMLLCGLWHGAAWNFVIWGGLHGLLLVIHGQYRRLFRPLPAVLGNALTLLAVVLAWVPFRAASLSSSMGMLRAMSGLNGIALPRMIVSELPSLGIIADPVTVMPFLGDGRTLSFPEISSCLALGWFIVLTLPNVHRMTGVARHWALTGSFALSMQALFFAPHIAPFLYFQF